MLAHFLSCDNALLPIKRAFVSSKCLMIYPHTPHTSEVFSVFFFVLFVCALNLQNNEFFESPCCIPHPPDGGSALNTNMSFYYGGLMTLLTELHIWVLLWGFKTGLAMPLPPELFPSPDTEQPNGNHSGGTWFSPTCPHTPTPNSQNEVNYVCSQKVGFLKTCQEKWFSKKVNSEIKKKVF